MNSLSSLARLILVALVCLISATSVRAVDTTYHFLKEIPVGGELWWDYLVLDGDGHRLYVAHHSHYDVIDLGSDSVAGTIKDTPGCHGFALATDLKLGFTSNGEASTSSIIELGSLKTLSKVKTGEKPDSIIYEPKNQEVYTFNGRGHSVTVYKATTGEVSTTILLPGKPEFAKLDEKTRQIYVNIEDKNEVDVIDTATHKIVAVWPVTPGESPSSMALDAANHRIFVGCGNKALVVLDTTSGKVVATVPIADGVDATVFDPSTQLIFSSCGKDGVAVIVHEDDPDHYTTVQTLPTAHSARTMAVDPSTHKIYLASSEPDKSSPENGQPKFRILIYGQ